MNNTNYPQLAAQYGTPLYVYHQAALTAAFAAYQTAFSGCQRLRCSKNAAANTHAAAVSFRLP